MHRGEYPRMDRVVDVGLLTRVEGEGSLHLRVEGGEVTEARLSIFEAPRYFEKICCGRSPNEVIDIVSRICGICPVAYQMSAVHAFESCFGIEIDPAVRALRRLMYCGEWIESHGLHVHLLHAPDFLGYPSAIDMAKDHREDVERGLALKKMGNQIVAALGGRAIHPVSVRVGGFSAVPSRDALRSALSDLASVCDMAEAALRWVATFDAPDYTRDVPLVCLRTGQGAGPLEYPMNAGRLVASDGSVNVDGSAWREAFHEVHLAGTNALHARMNDGDRVYMSGPSARVTGNADLLHPRAAAVLSEVGLASEIAANPYWSIAARSVEILHAMCVAADIVEAYEPPEVPAVPWEPRAGVAAWTTEAPRGILFHHYECDENGNVVAAQIVPPTSQNQGSIEADLVAFAPQILHLDDAMFSRQIEQLVRCYDPCISCSAHFLDITVEDVT